MNEVILLITLMVSVISLGFIIFLFKQLREKSSNGGSSHDVLLDTCALIDGRILELARTGFVPETLVVPAFVIAELQQLADGTNSEKRERARYGLDMIRQLQDSKKVHVEIDREPVDSVVEVDDKLIKLAKKRNAALYTTDYNLNKVADIEKITVLNVNELAQLLRPVVLPGERLEIKLVQKGNESKQAVGYLEDGTMVVVEEGGKHIGKHVSVEFIRSLQTKAGKMMFARIVKTSKRSRFKAKSSTSSKSKN